MCQNIKFKKGKTVSGIVIMNIFSKNKSIFVRISFQNWQWCQEK